MTALESGKQNQAVNHINHNKDNLKRNELKRVHVISAKHRKMLVDISSSDWFYKYKQAQLKTSLTTPQVPTSCTLYLVSAMLVAITIFLTPLGGRSKT